MTPQYVAINMSPKLFEQRGLLEELCGIPAEYGVRADRIVLEVTETALFENAAEVERVLRQLVGIGFRVALDDFGTGYSSLSQLRSLPFDRLKIDRSFISTMDESRESKTIISAIVSLGEGMGLPITAEGIETPEVLAQLKKFGTFKGQGYLYGHPGDAATARHWLELDHPVADQAAADREAAALRAAPAKPRAARG